MAGKIRSIASAGTLESSDCLVTVSPSNAFSLEYGGANSAIFKKRTEALTLTVLEKYGVSNVDVGIQDQGALEVTMRARLETALERAMEGAANEE